MFQTLLVLLHIHEELFKEMSRELLSNLGYHIIKEEHDVDADKTTGVKMCVDFTSKKFLQPKYAPKGISFVECEVNEKNCKKLIQTLDKKLKFANNDKEYRKRLKGKMVDGGLILVNDKGSKIKNEIIQLSKKSNFYFWDIHRIFFYCMKVFSHSILENWVSQSPLGIVFNEEENRVQLEEENYFTSNFVAIRYSERSGTIEMYFTYFVDCKIDPDKLSAQDDALHTENVEIILDDVYERMEKLTMEFYPDKKKNITIEIHSLSGFTEDAEFKVKIYAKHYRDWKKLNIDELLIDEHTLFKYSVIPWEAVMDYAFTKKTGLHTIKSNQISSRIASIEKDFAYEFEKAVKSSQITDPFTNKPFMTQKNKQFAGYESLYSAHVTRSPIKQRMLFFSRTNLKIPKIDEIKKIILEIKADGDYNYNWIGIMSGSGFTHEVIDYVETFNQQGVGIGLIDAVTKQLIVSKDTNEGKNLNQMFLSECIS